MELAEPEPEPEPELLHNSHSNPSHSTL
ncbi:hypothetical protein Goshw_009096 [Gossypium schwendimanii]|uniref:Uncharacterized protein n=1 Tax=Gossypium schwendimanii TaxID=34291 RepID=A0A7J9MB24_GOSSC|nr:hypothetical protein [Gossypium schwendimanii]